MSYNNLTVFWSGVPETERAIQGVGIMLSERMSNFVNGFECVSPRLIFIRIKVGFTKLFLVGVLYAPDTLKPVDERDKFWEELNELVSNREENERAVSLGDFNAWFGVNWYKCN